MYGQVETMCNTLTTLCSQKVRLSLTITATPLTDSIMKNCQGIGEAYINIFTTQMLRIYVHGRFWVTVKNQVTGTARMVPHHTQQAMMCCGVR